MTWIKICGITNLEDALTAVEAGADALGFVFYEKSPRKTTAQAAREIVTQLPPHIEKVGVFTGASTDRISEVVKQTGLTALQIHPGASPDLSMAWEGAPSQMKVKSYVVLPAARLFDEEGSQWFIPSGRENTVSAVFLDSSTPQMPGGTGKVFDWEEAAPIVEKISKTIKVVVAGGLTPANVTEAIRILKPWGVDVASGVEASPGKKDPEKVRAFITAVRNAEKSK